MYIASSYIAAWDTELSVESYTECIPMINADTIDDRTPSIFKLQREKGIPMGMQVLRPHFTRILQAGSGKSVSHSRHSIRKFTCTMYDVWAFLKDTIVWNERVGVTSVYHCMTSDPIGRLPYFLSFLLSFLPSFFLSFFISFFLAFFPSVFISFFIYFSLNCIKHRKYIKSGCSVTNK